MKVIVCLDDSRGMLFNNRRQSRDREVVKDVLCIIRDNKLNISRFSLSLFEEYSELLNVSENCLENTGSGEYCFVENNSLRNYEDEIEELIVYCWNRKYPSDLKLEVSPDKFSLSESKDFEGFSHPVITRKIFIRK